MVDIQKASGSNPLRPTKFIVRHTVTWTANQIQVGDVITYPEWHYKDKCIVNGIEEPTLGGNRLIFVDVILDDGTYQTVYVDDGKWEILLRNF